MFVGLDLGTTNVKAVLTETDGRIAARGSAPVGMIHVGDAGVEQDIEEIWSATFAAIRQVGASHDLRKVRAIGVSSQGGALQLLDPDGRPVERVISWLDGRGQPDDEALTRELGAEWFARHIGHGASALSIGQLVRLRRLHPKLWDQPIRIGFVGDVIVSRLCGRRAHDATSLSLGMLYNPWLRKADPELLQRLGIPEEHLPDLLSPRATAGGLLEAVARETSLPAGIPVSAAVHDQYASALGAGATRAGDLTLGTGTAWVLLAATDALMPPVIHSGFACTHVLEGLYGQMLSLGNGGSSVTLALSLTGLSGRARDLDEILSDAPAGCDGLRYWPFLVSYGGAGLAAGTTARLLNLRLAHTPAHVLRAVVEGLACEVRRYLGFLIRADIEVARLVLCGGAAASEVTPQIIADVTGLPIDCVAESDTSALGAAMIARGLVEPEADLGAISGAMRPKYRPVEPDRDAALYQGLFEEYMASLPLAEHEGRGV